LRTLCLLPLLLIGGRAVAGEARFATPPKAVRAGEGVKITFAVAAPTDAEVAVLDARGKVVRHLGAAALGAKNPPPPPFRAGLSQEVSWDGKDDAGKPALAPGTGHPAPLRVRVRLGLAAEFERIIGWSGQNVDLPRGMVCGPDGTLYVMYGDSFGTHRQTTLVTAHDRNGKYLRQVFPGPANLQPEKRRGWPRVRISEKEELPVVFHQLTRCTYPGAVFSERNFPVVTGDGRLIALSALYAGTVKHPDARGGRRLLTLGVDGSVPENFLGPVLVKGLMGFGHLALSPDEKHIYLAGLFDREGKGLCQVVWRAPLDGSGPAEIFLGRMHQTGKGRDGFDDPQGLGVDREGNLYVADYGNDRIAIFTPRGEYLDEIPVKRPDQVLVSRKTGAVYVLCVQERKTPFTGTQWGHWFNPAHNWKAERIVKFGGLRDKTAKATFENPPTHPHGGAALMTLDDSGDRPILWFNITGPGYRKDVLRIADRGGKLESLGGPILGGVEKETALPFVDAVATLGDRLVARHSSVAWHFGKPLAYDIETGGPAGTYVPKTPGNHWERFIIDIGDTVSGPDGHLYSQVMGKLWRHDAAGKPVPFAAVKSHTIGGMEYGHRTHGGIFVARSGDVYLCVAPANRKIEDITVRVIDRNGKVKDSGAVRIQGAKTGGIAVDSKGNIYMGVKVALKDRRIPECFRGKLPADSERHHPSYAYKQCGAILKFPPTGGAVLREADGKYTADCYLHHSVKLENVLWMRRGGYLPNHGHEAGCLCESTRFDIDAHDRLFVPDPFRFSVAVLDGAGNELTRFGAFGNMDSRGPDSPVPDPAIAFGWPIAAVERRGRVFVADLVNRRIVAVRLRHSAEAECGVTR
jgi:DNA-binding beta-propeller fold protein YncE